MVGRKGRIGIRSASTHLFVAVCAAWCLCTIANAAQAEVYDFDLPAQSVAEALNALSERTGVPVVFPYDLASRRRANPVTGLRTLQEALDTLLAGTGLSGGLSEKQVLTISLARSRAQSNGETSVNRRFGIAAFFASLASAFTASAQEGHVPGAQPVGLEEIIVSARKREERLQDVPASIAATSGETLASLNVLSITELDAIAPGLTFVSNPGRFGSGPSIALRGVSTQTQGSGVQDSVGIVIDGVTIERAKAGAFPDLSDIARVEVLRGPQGTLFGKNASAGVISITTRNPTNEFLVSGSVDYGTYDEYTARAVVSGPLGDTLSGRMSLFDTARDGYIRNIFDGSTWEGDHQKGFRGKLLFSSTTEDQLKLSVDYVEQSNDAGANVIRAFTPVTPQYVRDQLGSIVGLENDEINAQSLGDNRQKSRGAALQWDHSIGEYTLTALTARRAYDQDFHAGTYTWLTPLNDGDQFGYTDQDQTSAEVRIASPSSDRVNYVAGVYFLKYRTEIRLRDTGTLVVGTTTRNASSQVSDVDTRNYAAFAEANTNATEHLSFTTGVRWTQEKIDVAITGLPIAPGTVRFRHPLGTTADSATADKVSWRLGSQWRVDADRMFYVSAATGFKGPGFNVNTSVLGNAQPVQPETSTSYEAGFKSQFMDRRLTFNVNLYHSIFKNFQTQGGLSLPGNPAAQIILLNAEKLVTQGVETELAASLGDTTELALNASYIDATYDRFTNAQCYPGQSLIAPGTCVGNVQNLSGARLPNTPKWNLNLFAKHAFPIPGMSWRGFATLDYSWRSDVQWNALGSPYGIEPAYGLLGASLGMGNGRFDVKVYGKNLTDKFHTSGIVVDAQITHFLPRDYLRVVGVQADFNF